MRVIKYQSNYQIVYCRGRLNLPDNIPQGGFVDGFGRKHSAPTVDGILSLMALRVCLPMHEVNHYRAGKPRPYSIMIAKFTFAPHVNSLYTPSRPSPTPVTRVTKPFPGEW